MSHSLTSALWFVLTAGEILLPLAALGLTGLAFAPGAARKVTPGLRVALLATAAFLVAITAAVPWLHRHM